MAPLLVVSAVNILSVRLFYRFLGPEMYALWFFVNTLNGSFGFTDLGLGTAAGRFIGMALGAEDRGRLQQYWGTANFLAIPIITLMAVIFIALGATFGPQWFHAPQIATAHWTGTMRWAFVAGGCSLWLAYYGQFWLILSQAHFDFKFIGAWRSVLTVTQVATSLYLAWRTQNPVVLIWAGALYGLLQLIIFVWHAANRYHLGLSLRHARKARAKELFGISNKIFGSILTESVSNSIDRLILGKLAPPAVFAHYNICYNFGARISSLGGSVMGPVLQNTSRAMGRGEHGKAAEIFNESFDWTFDFYALGITWTIFWHAILLRLWLGTELGRAVAPAFTPLVISFCVGGLGLISTAQLVSLNRVGAKLLLDIARVVCLGLLALIGWQWAGMAGMAWGILTSRIITIGQDLYVARLIGAGGWLKWRTWRNLLVQFVVAGVFFAASRALPSESLWKIVPAALNGGLVGAWLFRNQLRKLLANVSARYKLAP